MGSLEANRAYEEFDIPAAVHQTVLEEASSRRPWTPDTVNNPGVEIDKDVYAEGILAADPRERQDRHDLLVDGRLERYRQNLERGQEKWDVVLAEQDFYQHPDELNFDDSVNHNRNPDDSLRKGDGDLLFLDLDRYEAHMVEVKPHEGYVSHHDSREAVDPDLEQWQENPGQGEYGSQQVDNRSSGSGTGGTVKKKTRNWREAWESVLGELENDWNVFQPEFVFGSRVLDASSLSQNPEYALPPRYDQGTGYVLASEQGYEKAESSEDLETLNEFFFRDEIEELVDGERPEIERKDVF